MATADRAPASTEKYHVDRRSTVALRLADVPRPSVLRLMLQPRAARAALKVALIAGTVLNVVNNGEQVGVRHAVNLRQVGMNFVVPYFVSSYRAARNEFSLGQVLG
jgi:hypothetical protein